MRKKQIIDVAFVAWSIFVIVMLLLPNGYLASESERFIKIPHFDKIVHCGLFGVYCFFAYMFVKARVNWGEKKLNLFCLTITTLYGLLGEVLQLLTHGYLGRTFTWIDLIADFVGAVLGLIIIALVKKKMKL